MSYSSMVADSLYANAQAASTLDLKLFYVIQHQAIISQDLPVLPLFKKIPGYLTCLTSSRQPPFSLKSDKKSSRP